MKDGHPRQIGHGGEFWQNVVRWRREWQTTSGFLPWEPHGQYGGTKFSTYSILHHLWRTLEWSVMVFRGSHSVKKDTWILNVRKKGKNNSHEKNCSVYLSDKTFHENMWYVKTSCSLYISCFGVYGVCWCMWGFSAHSWCFDWERRAKTEKTLGDGERS